MASRPIGGNAFIPWFLLATLLIFCSLRPVLSSPSTTNSSEFHTNYQAYGENSSQMNVEGRSENEQGITAKSLPEISLNAEPSLRFKKTDKLTLGNSVTAPSTKSRPRLEHRSQILKASSKDTYLDALAHSHTIKDVRDYPTNPTKLARREYTQGPVYRAEDSISANSNKIENEAKISRISYNGNSGIPSPVYIPSSDNSYSQPQISFGGSDYSSNSNSYENLGPPPQTSYGSPPQTSYGPLQHSYGPPQTSYGTLFHSSGHPYASSQQGMGTLQATYSTSHPLPDLFPLAVLPPLDFKWPISLKLNAFTLIKIVLKLIIFKMIVKFIAIVCLLLFIPKIIQHKPEHSDDDDDESRQFDDKPNFSSERLRLLTLMVTRSIEHYNDMKKNGTKSESKSCTGFGCQISRSWFASTDTWDDYIRLFKSYVAEEQATQQLDKQNRRRRR